jgi:cyclophilin family peptidyl-prolyl cis-trans isomerase
METRKSITYTEETKEAYINQGGTPFLDQDYTVFGIVVKGLDVVDKIAEVETDGSDRPKKDVKILKVKVIK